MAALRVHDAQALVSKYLSGAARSDGNDSNSSFVSMTRSGFGVASGSSWPSRGWVCVNVVDRSLAPSSALQLRSRRAFLELFSRLSATVSCHWVDAFESLWWPTVRRPNGSEYEDSVFSALQSLEEAPSVALSIGRPTLESVQCLGQFLAMDGRDLIEDEDWDLLTRLSDDGGGPRRRVEVGLNMSNSIVQTSVLRSLVDTLREDFKLQSTVVGEECPRIKYEVTTLWWENCRFLSASEDLELLAQLTTLPSSSIHSLNLAGAFFNSVKSPSGLEGFQAFSRRVLAPTSPLRSLDLTRTGIDHNCVAALCSALRYSSKLEQLSIGHAIRGAHGNFRMIWAWIFFAVFHEDSGADLKHLDVSGLQLHGEDLELVAAMLVSPHPGRTLLLLQDGRLPDGEGCEECELPADQQLFVCILDGSKVWTSPGSSIVWPQLLSQTIQNNKFEYEVMVLLADWMCILIPGYGCGWVVRSAVRCEITKPSCTTRTYGTRTQPGFGSLTYRGLGTRNYGVINLVRLLGTSLSSLDIPSCGLNSQDLDVILRACPNLQKLNVAANALTDLSPLVQGYMENRCRIASLTVLVESVSEEIATQLGALLVHPNSKCLDSIQLESIVEGAGSNESEPDIWTKIKDALSINTTLRRLHLSLSSIKTHEEATALIKPFHNQVLRYEIPVMTKTAFLSVVEYSSSRQSVSSLDHMALSHIFSFATNFATRRQVTVKR